MLDQIQRFSGESLINLREWGGGKGGHRASCGFKQLDSLNLLKEVQNEKMREREREREGSVASLL